MNIATARPSANGATDAFGGGRLPRAYRPFIGPGLKIAFGSIAATRNRALA
jgi:hypothetical protein